MEGEALAGVGSCSLAWLSDVMKQPGKPVGSCFAECCHGNDATRAPRLLPSSGSVVAKNQCCSAARGGAAIRFSMAEIWSEWNPKGTVSICVKMVSLLLSWMKAEFTSTEWAPRRGPQRLILKIFGGSTFKNPSKNPLKQGKGVVTGVLAYLDDFTWFSQFLHILTAC